MSFGFLGNASTLGAGPMKKFRVSGSASRRATNHAGTAPMRLAGKSPHNYNATRLVEMIQPILDANIEEENGNTRNKKRLVDFSSGVLRKIGQPYVRAAVTSEAAQNIKSAGPTFFTSVKALNAAMNAW